jgi:cell wall assembly regulator SMI1
MTSSTRTPAELRKAWKKLVATLKKEAPALATVIAPGATERELRAAEAELGLPLSPLVRELFHLQGGERQSDQEPIFEVAYLVPLSGVDSVMTQLERMDAASLSALERDEPISDHWALPRVPIAIDYSGNFVAVDGHTPGREDQVISIDLDAGRVDVLAPDLVTWVSDTTRALASQHRGAARPFVEAQLVVEALGNFEPGATRTSDDLERMGLALRRLEARWVDDPPGTSAFLARPAVDAAKTFAFTIEDTTEPTRTRFFGGGDSELLEFQLMGPTGATLSVETGSVHRRLGEAFVMSPVWYAITASAIPPGASLRVRLRSRQHA